ncbi:hypothetical protein BH787_gp45 [Gordonia phage GMA4]|uniref:hypothetical protein n=1 Tax=Gordonia phage GMA4 TaxID=1647471 RepID=UPI0006BD0464|nr:hypothetical protein BH787_gp45 [Gordonia phage GMA4]AKJ72303.1 hypothetical protein GMA4_28 [Gordonia phage GMA4]
MPDDPLTDYTWPPILRNRGEGWDQFFDLAFLIVGMVAGLVLSAFGWWCVIPVLVAFAILGAKYCFKEAKNEQRAADSRVKDTAVADAEAKVKRIRKAATQYFDELNEYWLTLIEDRIASPQAQVLKAVATDDAETRKVLAANARTALLSLACADVLGTEGARVRVNLFELQEDGVFRCVMPPAGRGGCSTREFTPDTETYMATMAGDARFIGNVAEEIPEEAESLAYETFATVPVGSSDMKIWGVLTADAPKTGELREDFDIPLMQVYAGLIGIAFACERFPKRRKVRNGTVGNEGGTP